MIGLLAKLFIKNNTDYKNNAVRTQYGFLTAGVSVFLNTVICTLKVICGIMTGAISVLIDGINNLFDAGSSVITILGFKIANKPVDKKHPFGHGRMEYIAAMIISVVIVIVGVELLISSLEKIISPEDVTINLMTIIVLSASILIKLSMFFYNLFWSKKLNSPIMKATAFDSIADAVSTFAVLVCSVITYLNPSIVADGYVGIAVSLFIVVTGSRSLLNIFGDLLGKQPDKALVEGIEKYVLNNEFVSGVHDIVVHDYGPGRIMVSLHAEIPSDMGLMQAHECIDAIEQGLEQEFKCYATIHVDPIMRNTESVRTEQAVLNKIHEISPLLTIHDFRIRMDSAKKILDFDVMEPYDVEYSETELRTLLEQKIKEAEPNAQINLKIDRPLV